VPPMSKLTEAGDFERGEKNRQNIMNFWEAEAQLSCVEWASKARTWRHQIPGWLYMGAAKGSPAWLNPGQSCLKTADLKELLCAMDQVPISTGPLCLLSGQRSPGFSSLPISWLYTQMNFINCLATPYLLTHKLKRAFPSHFA
jgi:hypothetical protein